MIVTKYELHKSISDPDQIMDCDCCESSDLTALFKCGVPSKEYYLCHLCATTSIGNSMIYPDQYDRQLFRALAEIAHWLNNQAIEREKPKP